MKKKTTALVITALLSLVFLPQFISYAAKLLQQPETGWVVWETNAPVQRVAWDGSALWAGHYKGGLSQWTLESGQSASYATGDGLSGNHVTSIAVDGGGQKWLALQDGTLNFTTDGASFTDLTPAGIAGENAWDVSLNGSEVWLGTLGGGVSQYSGGGWTTYNKANSDLPHDDIYAVVANSGSPWVGTIGYGVANLQGNIWVGYTLPVQIPDPLQAGAFKSNQAVTDIAIDAAGNKWFATDGSGVVVLDASNTIWAGYNTSNSELSSDFIQRIYIDPQGNYWFGTLGGGVSRLSANLSDWRTFNTTNTPLPEDDVLDVTMDDNGGIWFAAYDAGLTYYGDLPSPAPEFQLDLRGQPDYTPGQVKGYYLWVDPETFEWTLAWSGDGKSHAFSGEITADAPFTILGQTGMEEGDSASADGNSLIVNASEQSSQDSVTFQPTLTVTEITIRLKIDGAYYPYNIHIGSSASAPSTAPFRIAAIQPQAPVVNAGEDITITEGEYLVLSADVTDPDSPLDHIYSWDFGDGTALVNTLFTDHIYKDDGTFTAQLTVTDVHGLSATDVVTITVQNVAPTADFYFDPFEPDAGETVSFIGSFYDPGELDTHTITWDFGDGSAPISGKSLEATHIYLSAGIHEVTFTVTDNDGGTSSSTASITIEEAPTPTPAPTPTETETPTPTSTPTETAISTPTSSPTPTPTEITTFTATSTNTSTPSYTATVTFTPGVTDTPTASPTESSTPTSTATPTPTFTPTPIPEAVQKDFYLHGTGPTANPSILFLDSIAPASALTKYKDSTSVNFNGGNPWKDVGTSISTSFDTNYQFVSIQDLHVWLGLKNSDDQGTRFDLRAEIFVNGQLVSSGETRCITDITRNANLAKDVGVVFTTFNAIPVNVGDVIALKLSTRIGTNGVGNMCGGHSNAVGLRVYFDAITRPAKFGVNLQPIQPTATEVMPSPSAEPTMTPTPTQTLTP